MLDQNDGLVDGSGFINGGPVRGRGGYVKEHCLQTKQIRKICVFSRKSLSIDPKITNLQLKKFHKFYSLHKPENKYRIFVLGFIH